ncbi:MAG: transglycosylase family protein [Solirubrobacterales bacterium]
MRSKLRLMVPACLLGLGLAAVAQAQSPRLGIVEQPGQRFERSIEIGKLSAQYRDRLAQARKLHAAPETSVLERDDVDVGQVRRGIDALDQRIKKVRVSAPDFGLAPGVSQATLDAIASCESGGDPTAVDASGTYYGKYQFDTGTWASVGGSGSPAQASEAEQDYRASLLYSRAGSSPWPVCGQ